MFIYSMNKKTPLNTFKKCLKNYAHKKKWKKQVLWLGQSQRPFLGYLEWIFGFWTFFFVHFWKIHSRFSQILPLTLTFLLFITEDFLTPIQQLIFSFTTIKLKISVRDCGGLVTWPPKIERVFTFFKTRHFLTPNWQSIFSFAEIKLKISVRGCGGWSHDQQKIERVFYK